ncbi:uncharacterized protein MYCGRDRAFT_108268 [Zymoseptoria tritici IPO323]|uniref:Uncharacterized protein n=1 Tax=Zymoseptoria tritici (strain CBS 115943 / IPO323) TaxID=336722 RepID=F9X1W2_ZYMTI|nr:uncharacterized protein MYCGRDRAFT_108268 [Zymoseptoria tritici IPO323]EGP90325.1 hypothetical protein MYCGRDRAFT_108268 [Zymoseptoria tritici IPO323]
MAPTPSTENIARAMGSGPKAMAIVWTSPHHQETMYCITTPSPKLTWHDLPLLSKLGVNDIQYAKPDPNDKKGMPDMFDTRNRTLELFTSNCDPAPDSCGLTTYLPAAQGQVLFRRANDPNSFEGVGKSTLEPIELFIEDRLRAIQATIPDHCAVLQEVKDARDGFLARGEVWSSAWEENQEGDDGVVLWFI